MSKQDGPVTQMIYPATRDLSVTTCIIIDHAERYVRGEVHTQGIENFWSLLKRGLKGNLRCCQTFPY